MALDADQGLNRRNCSETLLREIGFWAGLLQDALSACKRQLYSTPDSHVRQMARANRFTNLFQNRYWLILNQFENVKYDSLLARWLSADWQVLTSTQPISLCALGRELADPSAGRSDATAPPRRGELLSLVFRGKVFRAPEADMEQ